MKNMKTVPVFMAAACMILAGMIGSLAADQESIASGDMKDPTRMVSTAGSSPYSHRGITAGCTYMADFVPVMKPKLKWTTHLTGMYSHEGMQPVAGPGGRSVKQIAAQVGYRNTSAFCRAYARHWGHAPLADRRGAKQRLGWAAGGRDALGASAEV